MYAILLVLLFFLLNTTKGTFDILEPESVIGSYYSPSYTFLGQQGQFSFENTSVTCADPFDACGDIKNSAALLNTIVVVDNGGCDQIDKVKRIQSAGALAVLILYQNTIVGQSGAKFSKEPNIKIPVLDLLPGNQYSKLATQLKKYEPMTATLSPDENSLAIEGPWIAFTALFCAWALVCLGLASYKLIFFLKIKGFHFSQPTGVLSLEIISNIFRFLLYLEPLPIGRGIWKYQERSTFFSYSFPYSFIATLVIAFFWFEAVTKLSNGIGQVMSSLGKFKIPFLVLSIILLVIEHVTDIARALFVSNLEYLVLVSGTINILTSFGIGLFFSINGIRVLKFFRQASVSKNTKGLRNMTLLLCCSGIGMLTFVLADSLLTAYGSVSENINPYAIVVILSVLFGSMQFVSITQILVFEIPSSRPTSSSHRKSMSGPSIAMV